MSHLDTAKALVAEHIAASNQVFYLLDKLTTAQASTTQEAVAAATDDLKGANDVLTQQINASLTKLRAQAAQLGGVAPAAAPAAASSAATATAATSNVL